MVALATGTTAPAMPRPRTGNADRPGQSASSAGDTRPAATAIRRISRQRTGRMERERRRPLSREPDSGARQWGFEGGDNSTSPDSPCTHKG